MTIKTCLHCRVEKPLNVFGVDRHRPDGLDYYCLECRRRLDRERYTRERERRSAANKERRDRDRQAARALDRASYVKHREKRLAARKAAMTPEKREAKRILNSKYYAVHANEDRQRSRQWYAANREYALAKSRAWRQQHAAYMLTNSRRYRAQKAGATVEPFDERAIFERDRWTCQICNGKVNPAAENRLDRPSLDHIIPIVNGGAHAPHNVQLTHLRCNLRRGVGAIPAQLRLAI